MLESQLEIVKSNEWDDILRQGDTTDYEAIQKVIQRDADLDKQAAKEVKSVSNSDEVLKKTEVILPEEEDADQGQHFTALETKQESDTQLGLRSQNTNSLK